MRLDQLTPLGISRNLIYLEIMEDKKTPEIFLKAEFSLIPKLGLSIKDSIKLKINFLSSYEKINLLKGVLSGLRRFLAIESLLNRMEMLFILP